MIQIIPWYFVNHCQRKKTLLIFCNQDFVQFLKSRAPLISGPSEHTTSHNYFPELIKINHLIEKISVPIFLELFILSKVHNQKKHGDGNSTERACSSHHRCSHLENHDLAMHDIAVVARIRS
jgi:hypothetical protein